MKKLITNLVFLFLTGTIITYFSNCSEDKESSSALVGIWDVTNVDYDAYVGSMTIEEYYETQLGLTQEEADFALADFYDNVDVYLESTLIEFEADYWYWTNISDIAGDEGTWSINDSETLIILDEGTIWETPITVHSLTSSTLNISFTMMEEMDLDEDPETPDVEVTFNMMMTLNK